MRETHCHGHRHLDRDAHGMASEKKEKSGDDE